MINPTPNEEIRVNDCARLQVADIGRPAVQLFDEERIVAWGWPRRRTGYAATNGEAITAQIVCDYAFDPKRA
jgi:hypothetical protein